MSFEAAQPILGAMSACLPADLRGGQLDAARWAQWLKTADVQVRHRLDAGEEDTLTNLLRFGVTFTKEYRIDDEYFARYGESTLVDSFAEPFRIDRGRHVLANVAHGRARSWYRLGNLSGAISYEEDAARLLPGERRPLAAACGAIQRRRAGAKTPIELLRT